MQPSCDTAIPLNKNQLLLNWSCGISYGQILLFNYQKVSKVKISCSYSEEGNLYWLRNVKR